MRVNSIASVVNGTMNIIDKPIQKIISLLISLLFLGSILARRAGIVIGPKKMSHITPTICATIVATAVRSKIKLIGDYPFLICSLIIMNERFVLRLFFCS
jgi:hypothetical protein